MEQIAEDIQSQIEKTLKTSVSRLDFLEYEYEGPGPGWGTEPSASRRPKLPELIRLWEPHSEKKSSSTKLKNIWLNIPGLVRFALALPAQYAALSGAATLGAIVAALSAAAGLYYARRSTSRKTMRRFCWRLVPLQTEVLLIRKAVREDE